MERTLGGDVEPTADAGQPLDSASGWDLTDATFVDEFDEQDGRYRVTYDSVRATPSVAVVAVVSHITDVDPVELDPLYESIDPDAVDALFTAGTAPDSRLTFQYSGYEITVGADDVVEVVAG